ncbi:hypothetical protein Tco_0301786, partial [Tanacetum coccineum]
QVLVLGHVALSIQELLLLPINHSLHHRTTQASGAPPTSPTINSNEIFLLTPKLTPPPLTTPPPALTQPSKLTSPVAINLDPIELLFSTPLSSPSLLDVLGDLPPSTTNPSPPRPSFVLALILLSQTRMLSVSLSQIGLVM